MSAAATKDVVIVFAKWPEPGRVKTRLIGPLTAGQAAAVQRGCQKVVWGVVKGFGGFFGVLAFSPDDAEARFRRLLGRDGAFWPQGGGDLGQRLQRAFGRAFAGGADRVVAIGTDTVTIDRNLICDALSVLNTSDAVIGQAEDGGYYLVGLRRPAPGLFERIDWGTDRVASQTCRRASELALSLGKLRPLRDLDRFDDLVALAERPADGRAEFAGLVRLARRLVSAGGCHVGT